MTRGQNDGEQELDLLLLMVRARFLARADASFDFDAGLSDVRDRAGFPFALVPAWRPGPGPRPVPGAVAAACARLEDVSCALECLLLDAPLSDLIGSQVQRATEVLARLASELLRGPVSAAAAVATLRQAGDAVGEADLILRVERGLALSQTVPAGGRDIPAALRRLETEVRAALSAPETGRPARLRSGQRRSGGPPGRRQAGGTGQGR